MIRPALLFLLVLAACHTQNAGHSTPPNYLRLAESDDIPTLDPARGYDVASWQFEDMLFQTLLDYDQQGRLVPELAASWEESADHLEYTFHLEANRRFTNGRLVTAADVKFGIERVLTPSSKSPGAELYRGIVGAERCDSGTCDLSGLRVIDPATLVITLQAVDPLFLHKLAMPFASAIPSEVVVQWGQDFGRHPIGSGEFELEEWKVGQSLRLRRRADSNLRLAGVERLVGVSDELAWFKYAAGELDVVDIPPGEFPQVMADPKFKPLLRHVVTMRTQYVGMNRLLPPFQDVRVRRAINHAIDREKLLRLINGRGIVAKGILPANMPGFNPNLVGYDFHPARARELLREAGLAEGFSSTLWVRLDTVVLRLAQSIQQDLAEIGVDITIKPLAWGPFLDAVKRTDTAPMFLLGWEADYPDPSNFLETLFHSKFIGTNNNTNYRNPDVDRLLDQAASSGDPQARLDLLQRVEEIIVEDAPWAPLYHPSTYQVVNPRVHDYQLHPLRPPRFSQTWIEP